jgi:type IV pilus assembly protein PilE
MLKHHGFTLIELLIGVAVLAIVSTLAWPSYQQQVQRARRADAYAALARLQQAQERHRSQQPAYTATLGDGGLGLSTGSTDGHYALATSVADDTASTAYRVSASASGAQSADTACRHLAIDVNGGSLQMRSGSSATLANDSATNRRCWNQ